MNKYIDHNSKINLTEYRIYTSVRKPMRKKIKDLHYLIYIVSMITVKLMLDAAYKPGPTPANQTVNNITAVLIN
nr:hypothetical protein CJLB15_00028 [Campylobacter phage CJLB-15]